MSPARVLETIQKENELQTLTSALDALLVTAHQLSLREQELQQRVKLAHDEVSLPSLFFPPRFASAHFSCMMRKFSNLLALDREPLVGRDSLHVLPDKILPSSFTSSPQQFERS